MLRIREIMTPSPVSLGPNLTLREAAERLADLHISGAPVVTGGTVMGVLSLSDIVDFMVSAPGRSDDDDLPILEGDEDDTEAAGAFYTDAGAGDVGDVVERMRSAATGERDILAEHAVHEAMTHVVFSLPPDATVEAAAEFMQRGEIHRLLVLDGGRLVGIVSAMDVARAVAEHKLTLRTYVFPPGGASGRHGWP